jgi:hypothetical protein
VSDCVITKDENGILVGLGEKGGRQYAKWKRTVSDLKPGETLHFSFRLPRSLPHHALFFGKLGALMDMQEQFDDDEELRKWLTVGAGYCKFVPGPNGRMVALPLSIAFHNLDEADFSELHSKVDAFLWTDHARRFLWGHLTNQQTYDMVDQLMTRFSK